MNSSRPPFDQREALDLWSWLVAGWAGSLDQSGSRTLTDGIHCPYDEGGSFEGVTRMMWGLGGWLTRSDRPSSVHWRGVDYDITHLARQALLHGTDPGSPGYWGESACPGSADIWMVEAGHVAFALWQSRERIWDQLLPAEQAQIVRWLEACGHHPGRFGSNFALFWGLNHASRKALGQRYDQRVISDVLDYCDRIYAGDGWFDDGPERGTDHFDDYNYWAFTSHLLAIMEVEGDNAREWRDRSRDRVRLQMESFPHFFSVDGAYAEHGRSLAYKFARLGAPIWAHHHGCWPHSPGMLRRLVGRHLRWYIDRGAVRADGSLRQALTSQGTQDIRERYISTGSAYWSMQAFGGLWSLAADDPFWTSPEEDLPVETGDFIRVMPTTGWVLAGHRRSGHVQRFSAKGGDHPAKYGKYHYSTLAPFNAGLVDGLPAIDGMLSLRSGDETGHRCRSSVSAVGEPGWLRFQYRQTLGGDDHELETVVLVLGNSHLRVHRIRPAGDERALDAVEGAAPLAYAPGEQIECGVDCGGTRSWALVRERSRSRFVAIQAIRGYSRAKQPRAWRHGHHINSVYGRNVIPRLVVDRVDPSQVYVSLVTIGTEDDRRPAAESVQVDWRSDDIVEIDWPPHGRVNVPPLGLG
ncbi:DUF2264 domain-containing protein [Phytoactinopolyspora alkaliphila]|uniref:DUF2264 domain-containing protein n=1 Tax=Phytoactinopolyspora alkaliphila TaxID=1783498 RepID=A0A6N9YS54_9ACTN|nr:DUF2264 domain-containing protein [Phytoactinopolyspora alkaliphila]NED97876.1 DUF2264 domain-containing protein [Phytoactinopolyspora alkaliphila]